MENYAQVLDIFDPSKQEQVLQYQSNYVGSLEYCYSKCKLLTGAHEIEAVPYMKWIVEIIEGLLEVEDFLQTLAQFPDIKKSLIDNFIPNIIKILTEIGLFPNPEVICICNRFYELIIQLTLKATKCKDVDPGLYWSQLPQFFKADQKFFRENTNTCSLDTNPYGNSSWGYPEYWNEFLEELEEGMEIDAVKVGRTRGQTIWSRATVISQDDDKAIRIRFKRETDYHIAEQRYKLTPFTVNRKGTRCSDDEWDWRESLGPGDKVDVYVNDMLNDIVGWLACEITNVVNQEDDLGGCLIIDVEQLHTEQPWTGSFNVHDPCIRKYKKFSELSRVEHKYSNDDVFDIDLNNFVAIIRSEGTQKTFNYNNFVHSKYYIQHINSFAQCGGFREMERIIFNKENPCHMLYIGWFAAILSQTCRYCLTSFVEDFFVKMVDEFGRILLAAGENVIRDIDIDMIGLVYDAMLQTYKRTHDDEETYSKTETFILNMAIKCIKSEVLKRKMDGISLICQMHDKLNHNDLHYVTRENITDRIKNEDVLDSVMKGHPQLIQKTSGLFKLFCSCNQLTNADLELLWNSLRNGDIETKNSIMSIFNDINFSLGIEHIIFIIDKMCSVPTNVLTLEEVKYAHCLLQNGRITKDVTDEECKEMSNKIITLLFKIVVDESITNLEIVKTASKELKKTLKFSESQTVSDSVFQSCVENIKNNKAVIQSLKIIKRIVEYYLYKNTLIKQLLDENIIDHLFNNLKLFKTQIKAKLDAAGVKPSEVSTDQFSKWMPQTRYTYQENIIKRIDFIDTLTLSEDVSDEDIMKVFDKVWNELVINSLFQIESTYFREWFKDFLTKFGELLSDELLQQFFFEKIKTLSDKSIQGGDELLKIFIQIFLKMNIISKKLDEKSIKLVHEYKSSYGPNDEETKNVYVTLVHPDQLDGIEALWEILLTSDDYRLVHDLIQFITQLYTQPQTEVSDPERFRVYISTYISRCQSLLEKILGTEKWDIEYEQRKTLNRVLVLLQNIIDYSQSKGLSHIKSLNSFFRGDQFELKVTAKIYTSFSYYEKEKHLTLKCYGNTTIFELRQMIAKEVKRIEWKDVQIVRAPGKPQISEKDNGRTLRDIGYTLGEKIDALPLPTIKVVPEQLMIGNELNPKAIMVFNDMFELFSKGKEYHDAHDVAEFCTMVLGDSHNAESAKVKEFIGSHGDDGRVSRVNFIKFYVDATRGKSKAVRDNITSCGFRQDFTKKVNEVQIQLENEDLASFQINQNSELVSKIFSLLDRSDLIADEAWEILNRLPPSSHELKKILNFEGLKEDNSNWGELIDASCAYKLKYYMYLIDFMIMKDSQTASLIDLSPYITDSTDGSAAIDQGAFVNKWRNKFVSRGGFQHLINILLNYANTGIKNELQLSLFSFILKIFKYFVLASVTITKPWLYKNISFIKLRGVSLKYLREHVEGDGSEPPAPQEQQSEKTDAKQTQVNEQGVSTAAGKDQDGFTEIHHTETGAQEESGLQDGQVYNAVVQGPMTAEQYANQGSTDTGIPGAAILNDLKLAKQKKIRESLAPKPDFLRFRDSLESELGQNPLENIEKVSVLKLLLSVSEDILSKVNNNIEEFALIEFCLSVSMSLLLSDQELLNKAILTNELVILKEGSTLRTEGCSDFISYIMNGLLGHRFVFVNNFNNCFKILMREAHNKEIQKNLLKIILNNILKDGASGKQVSTFIDIACPLMEEICADPKKKDPNTLLEKSDINDIINLETLFFKILDLLLSSKGQENKGDDSFQALIQGYLMILDRVLEIEPNIQNKVAQNDGDMVRRIFTECLFDTHSDEVKENGGVLCTSSLARGKAYDFLAKLCSSSIQNKKSLLEQELVPLCKKLPMVNGWAYKPAYDKRSTLGYAGIYNLQCICYMNAMLQQFYMTPAFRYGILAADDYNKPDYVEKDGRQIDDNVFHQLQRMFAFLDASHRRDYNPRDFCFSFKDWSGEPVNVTVQQDTSEFLNMIFDKLENALKPTPFKGLMDSIYAGNNISMMRCTNCGYKRTRKEKFLYQSLEVKNLKDIQEGFEELIKDEVISDYKCANCGTKCDVIKKNFLNDLPNVMIVHLKRLIFDLEVFMNLKVNSRYSFPQELNVKKYSLQQFEEDESELNKYKTQEELEEYEKKMEEYRSNNENRKELEEEMRSFISAHHYEDEHFDYQLSGIVIHRGTAEFGHYYSFINVNRKDPAHPEYNQDEWIEFNDSLIKKFNINNLEEECFGNGGNAAANAFQNTEFGFLADFDKIANNKNAYVLVYEKKKKVPVKFTFNQDNLNEKDTILNNLIDPEQRDSSVWAESTDPEDPIRASLEVPYFSIRKFMPQQLHSEIREDNFQFMLEQHVYSKEFLNFVSEVCNFPNIPQFKPSSLPDRIYRGEQIDEETKSTLLEVLELQINLYLDIVSRTTDSDVSDGIVWNMMRILSIVPECSYDFFMNHVIRKMDKVIGLLIACPEQKIRFNTICLVSHAMIVIMNYFQLDMSENIPQNEIKLDELFENKCYTIKYFLEKMINLVLSGNLNKNILYRKLGPYFKLIGKMCRANDDLKIWMIQDQFLIARLIDYYMNKKSSSYDKSYMIHEKVMHDILSVCATLLEFVREEHDNGKKRVILSDQDHSLFYNIEFFDKIFKEQYNFNQFKALKRLAILLCKDNLKYSTVIINMCLKSFSGYQDSSMVGYLEVLKELLLIEDEYSLQRRQIILGIPSIYTDKEITGKRVKYGLRARLCLDKPIYDYFTTLNVGKSISQVKSLVSVIVSQRERSPNENCIVMLCYLLEVCNQNKECFEYVLKLPSPFALFTNFYDWIFIAVEKFVNNKNTSYVVSSSLSRLYTTKLKENLFQFEDNIRAYIMKNHPEVKEEEFTFITVPCLEIYESKPEKSDTLVMELQELGTKPIFSLNNYPVFGNVIAEENNFDTELIRDDNYQFILRVIELKSYVTDNNTNGLTQYSLPQSAVYNNTLYRINVPKNTDYAEFIDVENKYLDVEPPLYDLVNEDIDQFPKPTVKSYNITGIDDYNNNNFSNDMHNNDIKNDDDSEFESEDTLEGNPKNNTKDEHDKETTDSTTVDTDAQTTDTPAVESKEEEEKKEEEQKQVESPEDQAKRLKREKEREDYKMTFHTTNMVLKLAITNMTSSCYAVCVQFEAQEDCNLFIPDSQMNFNINHSTIDQPFVYLMKEDPSKPFGSFKIKFVMKEIDGDQLYKGNNILMKAQKEVNEIMFSSQN